jgi:cytochrome c-type biogenesis protein CcmH
MTGWAVAGLVAALAALAFGLLAGRRYGTLALAVPLFGLAGYAWQGRPDLPGTPSAAERRRGEDDLLTGERQRWVSQIGADARWLTIADAFGRSGDTLGAVQILQSGLREYPRSAVLWLGLANALVVHGGGQVGPAAEFAYARAAALDRRSPAPVVLRGLALIRAGRLAEAENAWAALLANQPAGPSWRPLMAERLAGLRTLRQRIGR